MEKCAHCNAEELRKVRFDAFGGVSATPLKENGKTAGISLGAGVYGMLCTKCGTIGRIFINEDKIERFVAKK